MALQFDISDVTKTELDFLPLRELQTHTVENTGTSDVFIMINPIANTTFDGSMTSDDLFAVADRRLTAGDRVAFDANIKTIWAVTQSDYTSTIETGAGTIY